MTKYPATVSPPDQDFSELPPKKQHPAPGVRARQGLVFTDSDDVMLFRAKTFLGYMVGQDLNPTTL